MLPSSINPQEQTFTDLCPLEPRVLFQPAVSQPQTPLRPQFESSWSWHSTPYPEMNQYHVADDWRVASEYMHPTGVSLWAEQTPDEQDEQDENVPPRKRPLSPLALADVPKVSTFFTTFQPCVIQLKIINTCQ